MSILVIATKNHLEKNHITIRELLEAAYYKRYGKPIPAKYLEDCAFKWDSRRLDDLDFLYDFILGERECEEPH